MMTLSEKLKSYGKRELKTEDMAEILTRLQGPPLNWNPYRIAKEFQADTSSVCHLLRKTGVENLHKDKRATFHEKVKEEGYKDEGDFFTANAKLTYKSMAEMLGVSRDTVVAHYREWLELKKKELKS